MTTVINLYGGPGTGKSTAATGVFSKLKTAGVNCEYVNEYAKEITWEGTQALLENQLHVFAEQTRRQWRLNKKVDYIITDSPLPLAVVYMRHYNQHYKTFSPAYVDLTEKYFLATFDQFTNWNFVICRNKRYVTAGRNQTEEQAKVIDSDIEQLLLSNKIPHVYTNSVNAIEDILFAIEHPSLYQSRVIK